MPRYTPDKIEAAGVADCRSTEGDDRVNKLCVVSGSGQKREEYGAAEEDPKLTTGERLVADGAKV